MACLMTHYALMVAVIVYRDHLFEAQRTAPGLYKLTRLQVPEGFQFLVGFGERLARVGRE